MERTYKKIEIVGISETSFGDATQNAVAKTKSKNSRSPLSSVFGLKISRLEQQMTKPGKHVEIVNRQTDGLVEGLDAFAVPALRFTAIRRNA